MLNLFSHPDLQQLNFYVVVWNIFMNEKPNRQYYICV